MTKRIISCQLFQKGGKAEIISIERETKNEEEVRSELQAKYPGKEVYLNFGQPGRIMLHPVLSQPAQKLHESLVGVVL